MVILLRRFTKHVTDQNRFAVGLDVIVVVVGIFLGFHVSDWNETQKLSDREEMLLVELIFNLQINILNLENDIILNIKSILLY